MNDKLKKLTSKNPRDFEEVAYNLINLPDVELFAQLVEHNDFLFDFVKQNVATRLARCCNSSNYNNLLKLMKYYSPDYEEFIVSTLAKFADEELTDKMLEILELGTEEEKTYAAKYFEYINDPLAIPFLNQNAFNQNCALSSNCAMALAMMNEVEVYNKALEMLKSEDDFEKLSAVKFLVPYGNIEAVDYIIEAMKNSSFAENISAELPYLISLFELYKKNKQEALYLINTIINALGEVVDLSQILDFGLYEFFDYILKEPITSCIAAVLLNAVDRFNTLTENDEYLFDQSKEVKQEVIDVKGLLQKVDLGKLYAFVDEELDDNSPFVFTALEFTEDEQKVRKLLYSKNPTIVLKSLEVLKQLELLTSEDKEIALKSVSDEHIKNVIHAL